MGSAIAAKGTVRQAAMRGSVARHQDGDDRQPEQQRGARARRFRAQDPLGAKRPRLAIRQHRMSCSSPPRHGIAVGRHSHRSSWSAMSAGSPWPEPRNLRAVPRGVASARSSL